MISSFSTRTQPFGLKTCPTTKSSKYRLLISRSLLEGFGRAGTSISRVLSAGVEKSAAADFPSTRGCGYHRAIAAEHGHDGQACRFCVVRASSRRRRFTGDGAGLLVRLLAPKSSLARRRWRYISAEQPYRLFGSGPGHRRWLQRAHHL